VGGGGGEVPPAGRREVNAVIMIVDERFVVSRETSLLMAPFHVQPDRQRHVCLCKRDHRLRGRRRRARPARRKKIPQANLFDKIIANSLLDTRWVGGWTRPPPWTPPTCTRWSRTRWACMKFEGRRDWEIYLQNNRPQNIFSGHRIIFCDLVTSVTSCGHFLPPSKRLTRGR